MHTTEIQGHVIHHNGDYSGDVTIIDPAKDEMTLPFEVLKELVANYVRDEQISRLESASADDILATTRLAKGGRG
jgi:hypothetical protein